MVAAHRGDGNLVKRLVECGADVNVQQKVRIKATAANIASDLL